jgi:hypothetical protein
MVGCQNGSGNTAGQNNNAGQNTNSNDSGQNNDGKEVLIRFGHHDAEIDYEKNIYYAYSKVCEPPPLTRYRKLKSGFLTIGNFMHLL